MLLTVLLIVLLGFLIFSNLTKTRQIKTLTQRLHKLEKNPPQNQSEEFSVGFKKLTSEFPDSILHDPLTGLPAQQAFNDRFLQVINQCKRFKKSFGLILLNLNEFKTINKLKGETTGDKLLKEAADRLQLAIRQIDTVTRYAGDIYAVLLSELSMPETAAYAAQRLLDQVAQPFLINNESIFITANIGIAIYPTDGDDIKSLFNNANHALHQAKAQGENRYQFYRQEMYALGKQEIKLNTALSVPDVLQQLYIQYRPHLHTVTNDVFCVQAIPCIDLPDNVTVPFSGFAKIAENRGKLTEISEWTLNTALTQYTKWQSEDMKPNFLSIQVTLRQIKNPQFIYKISEILKEHNINPQKIILELTDDNLFSNTSAIEEAFSLIHNLDIQICLSVYALGHLALQKITHLPINYLKINAKMLRETNAKSDNLAILHMIITLAKDMNIIIMAEDVDNDRQKEILDEFGCEIMQGKLFEKLEIFK